MSCPLIPLPPQLLFSAICGSDHSRTVPRYIRLLPQASLPASDAIYKKLLIIHVFVSALRLDNW